MESNFDMFNHILEVVQKKEQKMIFYKPSQSLIKSSFETCSREQSQCEPVPFKEQQLKSQAFWS